MEQRQTQNFPNLPPNVFIQYANPQNNGDKNYYKIENIPFQPNAVNINLGQPISLINQSCVINQNNTSFISNPCVTTAPANYVSLSTGNWNHGMQQVKPEDQMIYQIMYPIIDNTGSIDNQQLSNKQTTVDANVLAAGTCTVLAPAKNISKKHIINSYTVIEKQIQYTNSIQVVEDPTQNPQAIQEAGGLNDKDKKKGKKEKENESTLFGCHICGEEFKSKGSLRFHMFHHNPKSKNKFQCIGCNEGFEKEKLKQEHELNCENNYKFAELECCFCDLPCDTPKQLRRHENKHRPIRKTKRYRNTCVCIECNKAFDAILSLKVHIQKNHKKLHVKLLDNKPFTCSECGAGFRYERSKLKHEMKAHMKQEATSMCPTMDRYIVNNNVSGQTTDQQSVVDTKGLINGANTLVGTADVGNEPQPTFIIHPGTSKMMEATTFKLDADDNADIEGIEGDPQFSAKQIVENQFTEGVGNTTYIIDNNSSNSIENVRIGNHSFVPVVDSSLYNISGNTTVAGGATQYTIEGVVNPGLGNYIIEAPAYIVETKPVGTHTMYVHQPEEDPLAIKTEIQEPKKEKIKKEKKKKDAEVGPFYCNICNAEFHSAPSLRFHSYHHNPKSKRFSCIGCEKAFEKDKEKEEHELSCDVNYTGNKFKCIFCDLPFGTPKALRNHENKHRPFKKTKKYRHMCICIKCSKAFDAINTLKMHIKKIHGGNAGPDKKKKKKKPEEQENVQDAGIEVQDVEVQEFKFEPFE